MNRFTPLPPIRVEEDAFVRAKEALHDADRGMGLMTAEGFLAGMERRAKAAQRRIREELAVRIRRTTE